MDHGVPPLGEGDPDRLGPYRLLGVLGAGGMGRVYLGRDDSGRLAAVKVLLPGTVHDEHMTQRFHREAGAAAAVRGRGVGGFPGSGTTPERLVRLAGEFPIGPPLDAATGEPVWRVDDPWARLDREVAGDGENLHLLRDHVIRAFPLTG
ncbi:hypothetical protein [Streptomyces sp. ST2-7A]|uniref:hypothetical protein n=1 Tax=Streptomyces sp. ST2-7A TaxID=2907214 RepID=UPI001F21D012|nr:hypothetical protein [Streptomyces sp. ST2-7A]